MNALQSMVQRFAGSIPGAWLFRVTHIGAQDRIVHQLSRGRGTISGAAAAFPTVFVTTSGRRSGRAHTVALVMVTDPQKPEAIGLIASNFGQGHDPDWCLNLRAHPHAVVAHNGTQAVYKVAEVLDDSYERWYALGTAVYSGYARYRRRAGRRIPVFELTPQLPAAAP